MKILILDDDGTTLYEQDDPGYIHMPLIFDGKNDCACDDDECEDPRCQERRAEAEALLRKWQETGQELSFIYHLLGSDKMEEFEKLPNHDVPAKVKLRSLTRNELELDYGDGVEWKTFQCPSVNAYSENQIMFSTNNWNASLFPWDDGFNKRMLELKLLRSEPAGKH